MSLSPSELSPADTIHPSLTQPVPSSIRYGLEAQGITLVIVPPVNPLDGVSASSDVDEAYIALYSTESPIWYCNCSVSVSSAPALLSSSILSLSSTSSFL